MANPWEQYQSEAPAAESTSAPWDSYGTKEAPKEDLGRKPISKMDILKESLSGKGPLSEMGRKQRETFEKATARDTSKVGQVPLSEYGQKITSGATSGALIGGGLGALAGPGAIVGAGGGAVTGALGGLAEAVAKDLGYGENIQTAAGIAGGGVAPTQNTLNFLSKSKLANKVFQGAEDVAKSLIPKYGTVRKIAKILPEVEPKLGAKEVEKAIGETATTAGVKLPSDPSSEMFQFTKDIEGKFGSGSSVKNLYEDSKAAFDNALAKGTAKDVTESISKAGTNVPTSTVNRIEKLFVDSKGNPYSGDVVVNNLKYDNPDFSKLTEKEQQLAKKALNDFVESKGFGRPEELARQWSEKEFVAKAKDTLPQLFQSKNYKTINTQMQNFGKDPAGVKSFKQELGYALKKMPIDDARAMWSSVGPNVNKWLVKDPAEFKKITDMINQAKDKQAVNRAASLLIKSGFAAREAFKEEE